MATRSGLAPIEAVGVDDLEKACQAGHPDDRSTKLSGAEREAIQNRRTHYGLPDATDENLFGLALSGGGIRSATFALGILQAFARRDLLKHVDYLSTVSGGGYIGTSLLWWLSGLSVPERERGERGKFGVGPYNDAAPKESFPYGTDDPSVWRDRAGQAAGPKLLRNLKESGKYLTPGDGINLMSLIAVVLRGVILNLLFWIPLIAVALGVLHVVGGYDLALWVVVILVLTFVVAALFYSLTTGLASLARTTGLASLARLLGYGARRWTEHWAGVLITIALVAGLVASIALVHDRLVEGKDEGLVAGPWEEMGPIDQLVSASMALAASWLVKDEDGQVVEDEEAPQEAAGIDQLIAGLMSTFGGLIAGLVTYFRTMRGLAGTARKLPGITTDLITLLAAGLIIFGVLLFCHGLAVIFIKIGIWKAGLLLAGVFLVVSIWVNINHISAHRMYRDRLMEAFMPAFDLALGGKSKAAPPAADRMKMDEVDECNSPFPIINTNLLLVDSKERRRKLRGGDSFILTPRYCGSNATGWVDCRNLMSGRMTLPTAMAISGAAANPNTGVGGVGLTRNRLIAVLMAFIGLRLGYWIPNFNSTGLLCWLANHVLLPNHVWPGLSTVLPLGHDEESCFLELSDGGHFENLGLYELVRRRVRLIIVCDGAQDEHFAFEDLQRAQRRIAADFGATLDLTPEALEPLIPSKSKRRFPEDNLKLAESGHVMGEISYADGFKATLIYLKTTLIKDLPLALLGYRGANPDFPDQSTADQFFDEEQFEAYRELGFRIAETMMHDPEVQDRIESVLGPEPAWKRPAS